MYSSIIYNSQDMDAYQVSFDRWMDKEDVVYLYNGVLAIKKSEILPFAMTWMQLESIMLSEISQRKTKTIWFHSYVDFKKQNKWAKGKKRERERGKPRNGLLTIENKLMVIRGDVGGEMGEIGDGD